MLVALRAEALGTRNHAVHLGLHPIQSQLMDAVPTVCALLSGFLPLLRASLLP